MRSLGALGLLLVGCERLPAAFVGVGSISAEEARAMVASSSPMVVDVRDAAAYETGHVPGAVHVELAGLEGFLARRPAPIGGVAIAVCRGGIRSLAAATVLASHGWDAYSLAGGMEAWARKGLPLERGAAGSGVGATPLTPLGRAGQVGVTLNGLLLKPAHMLLTLVLVLALWRARSRDLVLLRRSLVVFLAGESFCAANYLLANDGSFALKLLHDAGMVGFGALLPWAVFELCDSRFLRLTDRDATCALQRLCARCAKRADVRCGLVDSFRGACVALAVTAAMPLTLPLRPYSVTWDVFGTEVVCAASFAVELVELRIIPIAAVVLLGWAAVRLGRGREGVRRSSPAFFLGVGLATYALGRFVLVWTYRTEPAWSLLWEEATELLAAGITAWVLFAFRKPLAIAPPWRRRAPEGP